MTEVLIRTKRLIVSLWIASVLIGLRHADGIEQFIESFDGNGDFASESGDLIGFDNPEWTIPDDSIFENMGLVFQNDDFEVAQVISRPIVGSGSYTQKVTLENPTRQDEGVMTYRLLHVFENGVVGVSFSEGADSGWRVGIEYPGERMIIPVDSGVNIQLSIEYDDVHSQMYFGYLPDENEPVIFGPVDFQGGASQRVMLEAIVQRDQISVLVDEWSLLEEDGIPPGDFNKNGRLDINDIELLLLEIRKGTNNPDFELGLDGFVDEFDRNIWVKDLADTWFGDSNLDGNFNSSDLVQVFAAGEIRG